jgi:stress response protein SCP2
MVEGIRLRAGGAVIAESTHLDSACASSACATLVEIYERQGTWRMRVIGEVLAGSVDELLAKHGAKAK